MVISNIWDSPAMGKVKFTFFPTDSYENYAPITQSYALCLNEKGEVLLGRNPKVGNGEWLIVGGTVEEGEDPIDTLHRELLEEVDVVLGEVSLLGAQKAEFLERDREPEYNLRFVGMIKELRELTPDPDNGELWERKFISLDEFTDYVPWGPVGEYLAKAAKEWFENRNG